MGLIGAGERGTYVMSLFQKEPGVECAPSATSISPMWSEAKSKAPEAQSFPGPPQVA
jgi:hypothetical protein